MSYLIFLLKNIFSIPKTVYFNLLVFPLKTALRFPVICSYKTKIKNIHRNMIVIEAPLRTFMIKFGIEGVDGVSAERKPYIEIGKSGKVIFQGKANLAKGVSLRVGNGTLQFGDNFYSNCNLLVICSKSVYFGKNVLLGWDINIRDCDGHPVYVNGIKTEGVKPVMINDNVWIGSYVDIMKGVNIASGSIVAARSCVLKAFDEENILIGGYPAKKLKEGVSWNV